MEKVKIVESLKKNIFQWVEDNRREAMLLALILLVGAFLRLFRIDEYMTFLGDEGRDVIIVRRLLVDFDPILIGPRTSIGDMYLGPLYYYLMAPALLFSGFNPAGPAIMVALLGVATIFFVWHVARDLFSSKGGQGKVAAFVAAGLYAISPTVINFSKSSWNPNIMPFFSLLAVFSIWKIWSPSTDSSAEVISDTKAEKASEVQARGNLWWLIILGISMAFVLQSHYLGLLLVPVLGLFWILSFLNTNNKKIQLRKLIKYTVVGAIIFSFLMSPLVIFDSRHGWRNFTSVKKFFAERQTTVSARPWTALPKLPDVVDQTTTSLLGAKSDDLTRMYINISIIFVIWIFYGAIFAKRKLSLRNKKWWLYLWDKLNSKPLSPFILLIVWLFIAYVGLGVYKQHIYDHYFGFFFAAPFLLVGGITQYIFSKYSFWWKPVLVAFFIYAMYVNLVNNPLKYPPNRQAQRTAEVAEKIKQEAGGEQFNLAVIAERNYEDAYQYFLEVWDTKVVDIDPLRTGETITGQLFVVCELSEKDKCDPTHNPKAEIANFGWTRIDGEWEVAGITLYKLVPSQ